MNSDNCTSLLFRAIEAASLGLVFVVRWKGDGDILKDLMKTAGTAKVREALGDYLKALKTGKEGVLVN